MESVSIRAMSHPLEPRELALSAQIEIRDSQAGNSHCLRGLSTTLADYSLLLLGRVIDVARLIHPLDLITSHSFSDFERIAKSSSSSVAERVSVALDCRPRLRQQHEQ